MSKKKPQNELLTLMVVPRSGKVVSCNITTFGMKRAVAVLAVFLLVAVAFVREYRVLSVKIVELDLLRGINAKQAEQIDSVTDELRSIRDKAMEIRELEQKVRGLIESDRNTLDKLYPGFADIDEQPDMLRGRETFALASRSSRDLRSVTIEPSVAGLCTEVGKTVEETDEAIKVTSELLEDAVAKARAYPSLMPLRGTITSTFGTRQSPFGGRSSETHEGVDIAASHGTPVVAAGDARVSFVGYKAGYGLVVTLSHQGGYTSTYAHLSQAKVKNGETVARGSVVGLVAQQEGRPDRICTLRSRRAEPGLIHSNTYSDRIGFNPMERGRFGCSNEMFWRGTTSLTK